jgi:hypothetical protein
MDQTVKAAKRFDASAVAFASHPEYLGALWFCYCTAAVLPRVWLERFRSQLAMKMSVAEDQKPFNPGDSGFHSVVPWAFGRLSIPISPAFSI